MGENPCIFEISTDFIDEDFIEICASEWVDPRFVTVWGDEEWIGHVDDCATGSGWIWRGIEAIDGDETIELCGATCKTLENGEWSSISVYLWNCIEDGECVEF